MLNVEVSGDPRHPGVVITHGVTDNAHSQADLVRRLNPHFQVFAVDSLGHGLSPRFTDSDLTDPFGAASRALHETVREILAYRSSVGFGKGALIGLGHSMGGALLSHVAVKDPAAFRFLVLEDPAWLTPEQQSGYAERGPELVDEYDRWTADAEGTLASCRSARPHWPIDEFPGWLSGKMQVDRELIRAGVVTFPEPWQEVAGALTIPTYVVSSEHPDTITDHEAVATLGNPHLHVRLIDNSPHCIRRENTETYHELLRDVFAEQGIDIDGDNLSIPGELGTPVIREDLLHVIDETPQQTPWDIETMRGEPAAPDPQFAPEHVTETGTRIFEPRTDRFAAPITLVSVHGGGFVAGRADQEDERNYGLAGLGFRVVSPEYRLAPEHPYPAGFDDVVREINDHRGDGLLIVMGDSAGAGLAWSALEAIKGKVDAVVLIEPCVDLAMASRSFSTHAEAPIWNREAAASAYQLYKGRTPSVADVQRVRELPPALVVVNPVDPLRDEGIQLATDLADAGAHVELHMFASTFHGTSLAPDLAEQIDGWLVRLAEEVSRN